MPRVHKRVTRKDYPPEGVIDEADGLIGDMPE